MSRLFAIALYMIAGALSAGTSTTVALPRFELYDSANQLVEPKPKTWEECATRAQAVGGWTCVMRQKFTTVGTCDDVPKPEWPMVVNAEGFTVLPELRASDDGMTTEEQGYVPAPYPACWVLGWVPYTGDWHAPDLGTVHEPVYRPGEEPKP
jgi:hypothetical protein